MKKLMFLIVLLFSAFYSNAETLTLQNLSGEQTFIGYGSKFYIEAGQTVTVERSDPSPLNISNSQLSSTFMLDKGSRLITIGISQIFDEEYVTPTDAFWMGIQVAGFFCTLLVLVRIVNLVRTIPLET